MQDYPACKPLVNRLRGDIQVEHQLAKFEEEAKTFPMRNRQLVAIRYYLHEMLWNCQGEWKNQHRGITNYATFLDAIERWRYRHEERVCFVTFNYDTMLEESLEELLGIKLGDFGSYTSHPDFLIIKLHGSIDWALEFNTAPSSALPRGHPRDVIEAAIKGLDVSERYRKVEHPPVYLGDGSYGFPALAIPVEKKSLFACPPEHLSAPAEILPEVRKIITVGWRATEQHFLAMLKNRLTGLKADVDLMVVSGDIRGVRETNENLGLVNPPSGHRYDTVETGFSGLIRSIDRLEKFLQ